MGYIILNKHFKIHIGETAFQPLFVLHRSFSLFQQHIAVVLVQQMLQATKIVIPQNKQLQYHSNPVLRNRFRVKRLLIDNQYHSGMVWINVVTVRIITDIGK